VHAVAVQIREETMIELTGEQQDKLRDGGWPRHALNPKTGEEFVLLHTALYERVRHLLEAEDEILAIEEMYPNCLKAALEV
jgi:hypothetical protein